MSPNVKTAMAKWKPPQKAPSVRALNRACEITQATVEQVSPMDSSNMLYEMPSGLKYRLTLEIAEALDEVYAIARMTHGQGEEAP
jgi:hypothetical protein